MTHIDLLPLTIPVLFLFVFLEWRRSKKQNKKAFRFESTILNISFGLIERVFDVYFFVGVFFIYGIIQQKMGLFQISNQSILMWPVCLMVMEFIIYWYHRAGHTVSLLWGAHVAHHQCEEFNLTVAFRNAIFPHIFRSVFMLALPLIGFPAEMILICFTVSGLWQFFIHTTTINKLGFLEEFMMTPSLHRVHHGSNPEYLDKNFGGMFIIWDRLFGTYAKEEETVRYGIVKPLQTWNMLKAYTHVWQDLFKASRKDFTLKEKFEIWFGKPGDVYNKYVGIDADDNVDVAENNTILIACCDIDTEHNEQCEQEHSHFSLSNIPDMPNLPRRIIYYLITQLSITSVFMIVLLMYKDFISLSHYFLAALMIVFSSFSFCFLLDGKKWALELEEFRLVLLCFLPVFFTGSLPIAIGISIIVCLLWMEFIRLKPINTNVNQMIHTSDCL